MFIPMQVSMRVKFMRDFECVDFNYVQHIYVHGKLISKYTYICWQTCPGLHRWTMQEKREIVKHRDLVRHQHLLNLVLDALSAATQCKHLHAHTLSSCCTKLGQTTP